MNEPVAGPLEELQNRYREGQMGQAEYRQQRRDLLDGLLRQAQMGATGKEPVKRRLKPLWLLGMLLAVLGVVWVARALLLPGP